MRLPKKDDVNCYGHDNISLKLKKYDDIFSSFDPRPHSERALSIDFLDEARRASIDKPTGELELRLLVPDNRRNPKEERVILNRLKKHFERHYEMLREKHSRFIRGGMIFTLCGFIIMFLTAYIMFYYTGKNLLIDFMLIICEPAGWFFFWEGLDQIVFESKKVVPDLEFYEKMAEADIGFFSCKLSEEKF
jgi:hypothetical protein